MTSIDSIELVGSKEVKIKILYDSKFITHLINNPQINYLTFSEKRAKQPNEELIKSSILNGFEESSDSKGNNYFKINIENAKINPIYIKSAGDFVELSREDLTQKETPKEFFDNVNKQLINFYKDYLNQK